MGKNYVVYSNVRNNIRKYLWQEHKDEFLTIGVGQDEVSGDFQEELVAHMARATHDPENPSAPSALAFFATDAGFLGPLQKMVKENCGAPIPRRFQPGYVAVITTFGASFEATSSYQMPQVIEMCTDAVFKVMHWRWQDFDKFISAQ